MGTAVCDDTARGLLSLRIDGARGGALQDGLEVWYIRF